MDRIAVVGLSWRAGGPAALARFALPEQGLEGRLAALALELGASELVYLSTCNRVEVAFRSGAAGASLHDPRARRVVFGVLAGRAPEPGEAERTLRAWAGEGAVEHLCLVAAGLDSARVGEGEIAGQLERALARARAQGLAGGLLGEVAAQALRTARRVRRRAALDLGHTSLAEVALERVRERLTRAPGTVALIGVSAMTERCGRALAADGVPLVVVNRTPERARELAARLGPAARAGSLADFCADPGSLAALVTATAAREPVLPRATLERIARAAGPAPTRIVDLGVPSDVDALEAHRAGLEHVAMDELLERATRTREERLARAADARLEVDRALDAIRARLGRRSVDALVVALRAKYRAALERDLARALARELGSLDAPQRAALERLGERLVARFAHVPTKGLRELARRLGPEAVEAFLAGADDALCDQVRSSLARESARRAGERGRVEAVEDGP